MKAPTNDDIGQFIWKYGMFTLFVISAVIFLGRKVNELTKVDTTIPSFTCTLDELNVGAVVDFDGKSLVVTESTYYESIGRGHIYVQEIKK